MTFAAAGISACIAADGSFDCHETLGINRSTNLLCHCIPIFSNICRIQNMLSIVDLLRKNHIDGPQ